jgi:hypothetical protein
MTYVIRTPTLIVVVVGLPERAGNRRSPHKFAEIPAQRFQLKILLPRQVHSEDHAQR